MSFLIDPALLYAGGRAYRRLADGTPPAPTPAPGAAPRPREPAPAAPTSRPAPRPREPTPAAPTSGTPARATAPATPTRDAAVGAALMALFWAVSIGLYRDQRWTTPLWKLCRARSGRDWMLNSGVLRIDETAVGRRTHVVSALIFATYPLWLWLGMRRR